MNKDNKNIKANKDIDVDIVIHETQTAMIDLINNSGLPISILKIIVGEIYNEVRFLEKDTYDKKIANINNVSLPDHISGNALDNK